MHSDTSNHTSRYMCIQTSRCTCWHQCAQMLACVPAPVHTYMHNSHTCAVTGSNIHISDTEMHIHTLIYMYIHLHSSVTQPQAHAFSQIIFTATSGPPGWEGRRVVKGAFNSGDPCVWVELGAVTQYGHQGAPKIHPVSAFPGLRGPADGFCAQERAPSRRGSPQRTGRLFAPTPTFSDPLHSFSPFPSPKPLEQPQLSSLPAECLLQSPRSVLRLLLGELALSGLDYNVASTECFPSRSSCQNPTYFSKSISAPPRDGLQKLTMW